MIRFGEKVGAYTQGLDQSQFVADELRYDATLRNIELIGEAASRIPEDIRGAKPGDSMTPRRGHTESTDTRLSWHRAWKCCTARRPRMNEKELWAHLLAYNLIRLLMAQAASDAGVDPRSLSFKHTSQLGTQWVAHGLPASDHLFAMIAQSKVGHRPDRIEPRQRKRRPKPYPWLKKDRLLARIDILLHGRPMRPT